MLRESVLLILLCVTGITGCDKQDNESFAKKQQNQPKESVSSISDPNDTIFNANLPAESRFELDGTYGCRFSTHYQVIIEQHGTKVKSSITGSQYNFDNHTVDIDQFRRLWNACCVANLETLDTSYGSFWSTAAFRGDFIFKVNYNNKTISKKISMQYDPRMEIKFKNIIDEIMELLPPDSRLLDHSIRKINYSELPTVSSFYYIIEQNRQHCYFELSQEEKDIQYNGRTKEDTAFGNKISQDRFTEFWKTCSIIDLASLDNSYGRMKDMKDRRIIIKIEFANREGRFRKDILILGCEVNDLKITRLINELTALADNKI